MKLTRESVTSASRVMLPVYLIFYAWIGGTYFFQNETRLAQTPALEYAGNIMNINAWGALFLLMAVLFLTALLANQRHLMEFALILGIIVNVIWFAVLMAAWFFADASFSAGAWPFLGGAASVASYRSVHRLERG